MFCTEMNMILLNYNYELIQMIAVDERGGVIGLSTSLYNAEVAFELAAENVHFI